MGQYWLSENSFSTSDENIVGGKAKNLFQMSRSGLNIPAFGVLTTKCYEYYLDHGELPEEILSSIEKVFVDWNTEFVAVRSSMGKEDSANASFAGLMESYLYVRKENLIEYIEKCFNSLNSERAQVYQEKMQIGNQLAAVVIQKMIASKVSGVSFSRAPVEDTSLIHIDASWGLGEGVVSGQVEVDSFKVDRFFILVDQKIGNKKEKIVQGDDGVKIIEVEKDDQSRSCLDNKQISEISRQTLMIEKLRSCPSDIEWTYDEEGELFILQARDITQSFNPLKYYTDINLSESYPGKTSPMTSEFVQESYTKVFKEIDCFFSFSKGRKIEMKSTYETLISDWGHHLYYNLDSYYRVLGSLPGGEKNIENWHTMIGGSIESEIPKLYKLSSRDSVKFYGGIIRLVFTHGKIFKKFDKEATEYRLNLHKNLKDAKNIEMCVDLIQNARKEMQGFGLTALNDYLIMGGMKLLKTLVKRNRLSEDLLAQLIRTDEGVYSLQPLIDLGKLSQNVSNSTKFWSIYKDYENKDANIFYEGVVHKLKIARENNLAIEFKNYLENYGDRSFEELKLESMTLNQSPSLFEKLIKNQRQKFSNENIEEKSEFDYGLLNWTDRLLLKWTLPYIHRFIQTREKTRFIRGEYFGWLRTALLKIYSFLVKKEKFKDLTIKEFFALDLSTLKLKDFEKWHQKIKKDGQWDEVNYKYPESFCKSEDGVQPYFNNEKELNPLKENYLKGLGVAKGKIEGIPLVLNSPDEALKRSDLSKCILVTKTTDPAWVFIMSQCAGLISEKGSLLSHTAIIGRELGIPTIVGVRGAMLGLRDVRKIEMNGESGNIEVIHES